MRAIDVAKWFYQNNEQTKKASKEGNIVMQKLCYYAQAMYIAVYGKPLYDEKILAWENGPVVNEVYKLYRWYNPILEISPVVEVNDEEELLLKVVNSVYGYKTANELIESTHSEKPWKQFEDVSKDRNNNPEITKDSMQDYYSDLKDVYEANKYNDFKNERMYRCINCNFIYNLNNIADISKYKDKLSEISMQQKKAKSFNVYIDEAGELVVYE